MYSKKSDKQSKFIFKATVTKFSFTKKVPLENSELLNFSKVFLLFFSSTLPLISLYFLHYG
ncbi:hypothetical protein BFC23_03810 [Carnobacterium maltaromaticum]|nr:hypothetical protein BFC23_03810 [Carnobacterium maltaromaticum]